MAYCFVSGEPSWRISCNILNRWRVSDDESRRVVSEGEGACSLLFKVRSHLPLRGKLGWMTPRVGVKTTLTNGNAPLGALVPKQGPHFFCPPGLNKPGLNRGTAICVCPPLFELSSRNPPA